MNWGRGSTVAPEIAGALVIGVSVVRIGLSIVALAAAYGMWNFRPWGWTIQRFTCVADIFWNLPLNPISVGSLIPVAGLAIDIGILIYISQPDPRRQP